MAKLHILVAARKVCEHNFLKYSNKESQVQVVLENNIATTIPHCLRYLVSLRIQSSALL